MKKTFYVVALVLLGFDKPLSYLGIGSIKPAYISFVILLFLTGLVFRKNSTLNKLFFLYLLYVVIFICVRLVSCENLFSSFIYLFHVIVYSLIAWCSYTVGVRLGIHKFKEAVRNTIVIYCLLLMVDLLTQPFEFSIYAIITNDDLYQYGQLFTTEPNWLTLYFSILCVIFLICSKLIGVKDRRNTVFAGVAISLDLFLNNSRAAMMLVFSLIPSVLSRTVIMFSSFVIFMLCTALIFFIGDLVTLLPENMTYDIVDMSRNPRLNDFLHIYPMLEQYSLLGIGFGDLSKFTESMSWRETYPVVNQMWLQVFGMSGYIGLFFFLYFIYTATLSYRGVQRLLVFLLFIIMQVHNAMFMIIPFITFAMVSIVSYFQNEREC